MAGRGWPPSAGGNKCVIGMVHLLPLPGSPIDPKPLEAVVEQAVADARALEAGGVDALLVQNRGDRAFGGNLAPPHVVAAMGAVVYAVVRAVGLPIGVHVLRNDIEASLAIAHASGGRFIRASVLTGSSESAQGRLEGNPHAILTYRRALAADNVAIYADVFTMHNRTPLIDAVQAAEEAVFFGGSDAVIVAHPETEQAVALIDNVTSRVQVPVLLGGYTTVENAARLLRRADGAIVGGAFERDARTAGVDVERVRRFLAATEG